MPNNGETMIDKKTNPNDCVGTKRQYSKPELKVYGDVAELTRGCNEDLVQDSAGHTGSGDPSSCTSSP